MASADGYVLPKPGIPKTLGILNVIFGVLLVLLGLCTVGMLAGMPALFQGLEKFAKEAQSKQEAQSKADIKGFDDRIAAASTDEEKKAIEAEKASAIARQPKMAPVDLSDVTKMMDDPTIKTVNLGGAISGLLLHIMLLIAGIGLIRLTTWGRSMSLWWAGLQIVQVIALTAATIVYVLPANQANMEKMFTKLDADAKAKGVAQPGAGAANMTKSMSVIAVPMAVAQSMTGMVYPVVLLILLNTGGARAAILAKKKSEQLDGF